MKVNPNALNVAGLNKTMDFSHLPSLREPGEKFATDVGKGGFKEVMVNLTQSLDQTMAKPDELLDRALTTGDVDIHEVMVANAKADITINMTAQVVTKVVQAYERVQQIQV